MARYEEDEGCSFHSHTEREEKDEHRVLGYSLIFKGSEV